ncbi:MAG TPA: serine/threonine-protein kinase [Gemmataceae bacterium]|nr:serine/threonine-protein kinase [Gemmataceae bacterium]
MSITTKGEAPGTNLEEERLAQALINRGLVSRAEIDRCRSTNGATGPEALLSRLIEANSLTPEQYLRVTQELTVLVGQQIPGYQLLEKLGQGSMGIVFKARQLSIDRLVAIKVLQPRLATNPKDLERFLREAHLVARLSHNNIVQAIDAGSTGKVHYFVMEYIEGTTIDQELRAGKVYDEREGLEIIIQIAQALDHAHRRQLIHRDIKPANIILTKDGIAKLADLGLARQAVGDAMALEEKNLVVGTPFYIAPEQVHGGQDIDPRADIYSLGATLYHMVTGQPPFPGTQVNAVLEAHLNRELTPPDHINTALSGGLGEAVEFMMAKDRSRRYASVRDLILDLECLLAGEPPKLARQQIEARVLEELGKGEAEEEDEPRRRGNRAREASLQIWIWILGVLLGVSVLVNLILVMKR